MIFIRHDALLIEVQSFTFHYNPRTRKILRNGSLRFLSKVGRKLN